MNVRKPKPVNRHTNEGGPFANAGPLQMAALGMMPKYQMQAQLGVNSDTEAQQLLYKRAAEAYRDEFDTAANRKPAKSDAYETVKGVIEQVQQAAFRGYRRGKLKMSANSQAQAGANAQTLTSRDFEELDDTDITEARVRTSMTEDLQQAGFTRSLSLARMVYRWPVRSEAHEADRSMDARSRGVSDTTERAHDGVLLPITHIDYELSWREIQNSQNFGEPIDDREAEEAGESLAVAQEELMVDGTGIERDIDGMGQLSVDGYTNTDFRITDTAPGTWDTPANVLDTLDAMQQDLHGQSDDGRGVNVQNGVWLYYHPNRWSEITLTEEPRGDGNMSIRDRIEQDYPWVDLRQSGALDPDEVVMVAQDPHFVELANASAPSNFSWEVEGGFGTRYKVLNAQIPAIKGTFGPNDGSVSDAVKGVVHYTGVEP